jgi:hypothetical protein
VQDKVWVRGPGREQWEVYVVKGDSATYADDPRLTVAGCCAEDAATTTVWSGCCG